MLLQNLYRRYLYSHKIARTQRSQSENTPFPNCDNYGVHRSSNPNPIGHEVKLNDNALDQPICSALRLTF